VTLWFLKLPPVREVFYTHKFHVSCDLNDWVL